jgi:hypothetical protein
MDDMKISGGAKQGSDGKIFPVIKGYTENITALIAGYDWDEICRKSFG